MPVCLYVCMSVCLSVCIHTYLYACVCQWPFQDPRLEVPTIYKAYVRPM